MDSLRPNLSAMGAAIRDPISVPIDNCTLSVRYMVVMIQRMGQLTSATIVPDLLFVNTSAPVSGLCVSANRLRKSGISRNPEICPVSYPKMKPPMDTRVPISKIRGRKRSRFPITRNSTGFFSGSTADEAGDGELPLNLLSIAIVMHKWRRGEDGQACASQTLGGSLIYARIHFYVTP